MCFSLLDSHAFIQFIRYLQIIINICALIASFEIIIVLTLIKKSVKQIHENNELFVDLSVLMIELTIFDMILSLIGIYGLYKESFSWILIYGTVLSLQYFLFLAFSMNLIQLLLTALRTLIAFCYIYRLNHKRNDSNLNDV